MKKKSKILIGLESLSATYMWFLAKVVLGVVAGYSVHNYIVQEGDRVFIDWALYAVGAGALLVLYLISDFRAEYRHRTEQPESDGIPVKSKR